MAILNEYRFEVMRKGSPVLEETPSVQYNFQSTFGYPEETARHIKDNNNTKDLKGKAVHSDTLFIDIDESANIDDACSILRKLGVGHEIWSTGNRGCHIHIPIKEMVGTKVVYSQTTWLKDVGLWPLVDTSIYREGGQFRVPGALHQKTGKPKVKTGTIEGTKLRIKTLTPPPIAPRYFEDVSTTASPSAVFDYMMNLLAKRSEGGRHQHMFILWCRGREAGYSVDQIHGDILAWNDRQDLPHPTHIVQAKLRGFR